MDADDGDLVDRVHGLSDLELAVLLSLVSREHCVVGTPDDAVGELVDELRLIASDVFGLRCAVVDCHADMTLEDFAAALLVQPSLRSPVGSLPSAAAAASTSAASASATATPSVLPPPPPPPCMANVVVARHLNCAPQVVQIQALELMRTHRIFTATAVQPAPRPFLLVAVVAAERGFLWDSAAEARGGPRSLCESGRAPDRAPHMTGHLNDLFLMGHWHDPDDGFPNLEDQDEDAVMGGEGEDVSTDSESIVRRSDAGKRGRRGSAGASLSSRSTVAGRPADRQPRLPSFSDADIDHLAALAADVRIDMEVLRYLMNVVAFLRAHRAVAVMGPATGGLSCISPSATKHFEKLAQCLAPLHRLDYVTPALVALAARKTYLHRIRTVPVGHHGSRPTIVHERSMQWGSEKAAVQALLEGVSPEDVIEDVLQSVVPPV